MGAGRLLRQFQRTQSGSLDFAESRGLTAPQFSVLSAIVSDPGIDQRQVTIRTSIDKSTVAEVISRLVERGLVGASRSIIDGRRDHLVPQTDAVRLIYEGTPELLRRHDEILNLLSAEERERFLQALQTAAYADQKDVPGWYVIPSPDGQRPALEVQWGLGRLVRGCVQRHGRLWSRNLAKVPPVQALAMIALSEEAGLDQRSLGEAIGLDKASVTEMLSRMMTRGWVEKSKDPTDGRRRILRLTEAGGSLIPELVSHMRQADEEFLAPLSEAQRDDLLGGLMLLTGEVRTSIEL